MPMRFLRIPVTFRGRSSRTRSSDRGGSRKKTPGTNFPALISFCMQTTGSDTDPRMKNRLNISRSPTKNLNYLRFCIVLLYLSLIGISLYLAVKNNICVCIHGHLLRHNQIFRADWKKLGGFIIMFLASSSKTTLCFLVWQVAGVFTLLGGQAFSL